MNYAYVAMAGVVTDYPTLNEQEGYISFRLRDSAGELRVQAYRAVSSELIKRGQVPMPGDRITIEGTLRLRDDEATLTLNNPDELRITPSVASRISLNELENKAIGERVQTTAQVRRLRDVGDSLRIVNVRDMNDTADVLLPLRLTTTFGAIPVLQVGDWVAIEGVVGEFRERKQINMTRAKDIAPLHVAREFDLRPISELSGNHSGQWVAISGSVRAIRNTAQATRIELADDAGNSITVALFDTWHIVPFSRTLKVGDVLAAQGEWQEQRNGRFELRPEIAMDLRLR
jgi:DNA/RNA endonuclease YhcR with UshA esterase domain